MATKSFGYAVLEGIAQEMRADPYLSLCYEYEYPSAVGPTGELLDLGREFPYPRTSLKGFAIDEAWFVGWASGMAMAGTPAIARIPFMASLFAVEQIWNQIGKLRLMTGGQASMSVVLWIGSMGRMAGLAAQHTDAGEEAIYCYFPGLKVVCPSNAYDAKGLMISAIRDPDPVVYLSYSGAQAGAGPEVPDEAYEVPIGPAEVRQEGTDLTIVAWGAATIQVARALPDIEAAGISAEYIDPRTLKPLDVDTLAASVDKTGRLLVVDFSHNCNGYGSHVVAEVAQRVSGAKFKKLAFPDAPAPAAAEMIAWMTPDAPKIVEAAQKMMAL